MQELNIALVGAFIGTVVLVIGLGLAAVILVLRARKQARRRLARVSRKRLVGLDIEEARQLMLRQKTDTNAFFLLSNALARVFPLLDTARLRANIQRADLRLPVGLFVVFSLLLSAILTFSISIVTDYPPLLLVFPCLLLGMFLMDSFVNFRGEIIANRFMGQLPDAIDTVIRGIRAGLPVTECVGTIGQEFSKPIGPYFQSVSERVQLGEPLDSSLWRVARSINRPEMDFFAISIAIQMETGGSLAEALGNLADLLRQRQRLKLKIKAISSEAKASAIIIGLLPFIILIILLFMSPNYVLPLFTDPRGHMMLAAGLGSILVGAFVMWRMTQFEI